jgi:hypothetical protein
MLAMSVLDTILSMDKSQQWLTFLSSKGYLQHLVVSLVHDDPALQLLLAPSPDSLRALYLYESKMVSTRQPARPLPVHNGQYQTACAPSTSTSPKWSVPDTGMRMVSEFVFSKFSAIYFFFFFVM